jgi:hypothetical protein
MPITNDKTNRTPDPQIKVRAHIKEAKNTGTELLVFTIPLGPYFEIVAICNIPGEGETESDCYCKFRMSRGSPRPGGFVPHHARHVEESRDVRRDDFENGEE